MFSVALSVGLRAQALLGTLPFGARTFLHLLRDSGCLANSGGDSSPDFSPGHVARPFEVA